MSIAAIAAVGVTAPNVKTAIDAASAALLAFSIIVIVVVRSEASGLRVHLHLARPVLFHRDDFKISAVALDPHV
jgi:hypothetical protein